MTSSIDIPKSNKQGQDSQNFLKQIHKILVALILKILRFYKFLKQTFLKFDVTYSKKIHFLFSIS